MADRFKKISGSGRIIMACLLLEAGFVSLPLLTEPFTWKTPTAGIINLAAAVISYVCFRECFGRREIGLLGSMFYTWCPYRISTLYCAGDLRESAAWCLFPVILWGLDRLYREKHGKNLWILFAAAFTLLRLSSVTLFVIAVGTAFLWMLLQGRYSCQKERLLTILKTFLATGLLNIGFLVLFFNNLYKNAGKTANMIPQDIRAGGLYPIDLLLPFPRGGSSVEFWKNGMNGTLTTGVGFAVILCVLLYLWGCFTGRYEKEKGNISGKKLIVLAGILIWFASSSFPWELFQNKNLIFSAFLIWMKTPAKWGIGACAVLIFAACHTMLQIRQEKESVYQSCFGAAAAVAFLTTLFHLESIRYTKNPLAAEETEGLKNLLREMGNQSQTGFMIPRLAVLTVLFVLLAGTGVWILRRNRKYPFSGRQQLVLFGVSAAALLASLPLFVDYIVAGENFTDGGVLLVASVRLHNIGFDFTTSYQLVTAAVNIAAAWAAYGVFRKCFKSVEIGVFGTVLFTLSPFRLYGIYEQAKVGGAPLILTILTAALACMMAKWLLNGKISLKAVRGVLAGICLFTAVLAMYQLNDILNTQAAVRPDDIGTALIQQ